jgi:5-methyltetrahydrofolate--homocysteine methyltransferase
MSCLLTSTEKELGKVIEELKKQGLREKVKVVIGGAALSERTAGDVGADVFAPDVITGLDIIKKWSGAR